MTNGVWIIPLNVSDNVNVMRSALESADSPVAGGDSPFQLIIRVRRVLPEMVDFNPSRSFP